LINANDDVSNLFQTIKGIRQGGSLSLLSSLMVSHTIDDNLSILQHGDYTFVLLEHDLKQAHNIK
jgi:hypothetical protein